MTFDIDWPHGHMDDYLGYTAELLTNEYSNKGSKNLVWILKHPRGVEDLIIRTTLDGRSVSNSSSIRNKPAPKKKVWVVTYKVKNVNEPGPFAMVYRTEGMYRASPLHPLHYKHEEYEVLDVHTVEYED